MKASLVVVSPKIKRPLVGEVKILMGGFLYFVCI